jgi:hypothetical protein
MAGKDWMDFQSFQSFYRFARFRLTKGDRMCTLMNYNYLMLHIMEEKDTIVFKSLALSYICALMLYHELSHILCILL